MEQVTMSIKINREVKTWVEDTYEIEVPKNWDDEQIERYVRELESMGDLEDHFIERDCMKYMGDSYETGEYEVEVGQEI